MKKKFFIDIIINLLSSFLLIGLIQLIIFPLISSKFGVQKFAEIVMLYGMVTVIVNSTGNSLNNTYLLDRNEQKNYNRIFIYMCLQSFVACFIFLFASNQSVITFLFLCILVVFQSIRVYAMVVFRENLNYIKMLKSTVWIIIGNLIGLFLFNYFNYWELIFIIGDLFGIIYIQTKTKFIKISISRASDYLALKKNYNDLVFSNIISNSIVYLDRLIILPLLGAYNLAIYYPASTVSKMLMMIVTPMVTVGLTYLSKFDKPLKKLYKLTIISLCFFLVISFFVLKVTSPIIIEILYPDLLDDSLIYLDIISATVLISIASSVLNTFLMRISSFKIQKNINMFILIIYFPLSVIMSKYLGLMGFCISTLIINVIKLIIIFIFGNLKIRREG